MSSEDENDTTSSGIAPGARKLTGGISSGEHRPSKTIKKPSPTNLFQHHLEDVFAKLNRRCAKI